MVFVTLTKLLVLKTHSHLINIHEFVIFLNIKIILKLFREFLLTWITDMRTTSTLTLDMLELFHLFYEIV